MDDYDKDCPMQDADFKVIFLRLKHILCEIHKCNGQRNEAETAHQASNLQQRHDILMEEFHESLKDVETDSQCHYVMRNLPFSAKAKRTPPSVMNYHQKERQLGWHRTLSNIRGQSERFQPIYGWLEFQYIEFETLTGQIATATPEERLVLEEQLAVVEAEYKELAKKILTDGARHGLPITLEGGGQIF